MVLRRVSDRSSDLPRGDVGAGLNASAARFRNKAIVEEPDSAFVERLVRGLFETPAGEILPIPDLKIRAEFQLPLEADLPQSPFQLKFVAEVGEGGKIEGVHLVSKPPVGPIPLKPWLKPLVNIPIIGPLVSVRAKAVEMAADEKKLLPFPLQILSRFPLADLLVGHYQKSLEQTAPDRALLFTTNYLFFDLTVENGKMVFDAGRIPAIDFEKRGLAVYRVPEHLHQLVGMILKGRESHSAGPVSGSARSSARTGPLRRSFSEASKARGSLYWHRGTVEITGDFSNRVIEVDLEEDLAKRMDPQKARKLRLAFTGGVPPGGHRITVRGGFASPSIEIAGLKAIEYVHPDRLIRASDTASQPTPFKARVSLNPSDSGEIRASFSWNHPDGFKLEEILRQNGKILSMIELPQGGEVKEFTVRLNGLSPEVSIKQLRARSIRYQGHGVLLRTSENRRRFEGGTAWINDLPSGAGLADLSFQLVGGRPRFAGTITSHMDMDVYYHLSNDSVSGLGKIQFRPLAGIAPLTIGPDEKNPDHTRISLTNTRLYARLPRLGLRVNSKGRKGFLSVKVAEVDLDVAGTVHVVPERREVEVLAEHPGGGPGAAVEAVCGEFPLPIAPDARVGE
ncbi:MAG: hypothetical protein HYY44_00250 [Deltaproteobacteria bacterium]|nr:hypothetical protein [Deltaproteobacteria bacterium]